MTLLIIFFSISIIFSFLCSIWEAVLLSIPRSRVEILNERGTWVGAKLKEFKKDVDKPLAAILSLNTIAHTVGSIGVGSQAAKIWGGGYTTFLGINVNAEAIVAALMTLGILILSEIIPKTIGANYSRSLTSFTVYGVNAIMIILFPLVWFSEKLTKLLKRKDEESSMSRSEFYIMAKMGAEAGTLDQEEYKILQNLKLFKLIKCKDVMTPRTVIHSATSDMNLQEFFDANKDLPFSRIPIYSETIDNIKSYVLKDDVFQNIILGKSHLKLEDISRNIFAIHETSNISSLLTKLVENNEHIALIVDEYGGVSGIVTMEDLIETLLGIEIVDESDTVEDMRLLAHKKWEERAKRMGTI